MVDSLRDKKVIHVAVGALHCLAVTESGQVNILRNFQTAERKQIFLILRYNLIGLCVG